MGDQLKGGQIIQFLHMHQNKVSTIVENTFTKKISMCINYSSRKHVPRAQDDQKSTMFWGKRTNSALDSILQLGFGPAPYFSTKFLKFLWFSQEG